MQRSALVYVGSNPSTVKEAYNAIMQILKQPNVDNSTKVAALETLRNICSVNNTSISNCSFTSK